MNGIVLKNKNGITSLELLEQINFFGNKDGIKNELLHKNLLSVIRDEFEEEINELKIQPVEYKDKKGQLRPMYNLTLAQAKQVLIRESKQVRRAVIKYIEELENKLNTPQPKFNRLYYNGRAVMTVKMLADITGVSVGRINYYSRNIKSLKGDDLRCFKIENNINDSSTIGILKLLNKNACMKLLKLLKLDNLKRVIFEYFDGDVVLNEKKVPDLKNISNVNFIEQVFNLMDILMCLNFEQILEIEKNYFATCNDLKRTGEYMISIFSRAKLKKLS